MLHGNYNSIKIKMKQMDSIYPLGTLFIFHANFHFLSLYQDLKFSLIVLIKNKEHVIPYGPFIVLALLIINFTKLNIKEIFEKVLNIIS